MLKITANRWLHSSENETGGKFRVYSEIENNKNLSRCNYLLG
jgi:hypothetical protein